MISTKGDGVDGLFKGLHNLMVEGSIAAGQHVDIQRIAHHRLTAGIARFETSLITNAGEEDYGIGGVDCCLQRAINAVGGQAHHKAADLGTMVLQPLMHQIRGRRIIPAK
ncbi:MAG: Uncharacterised protein [SAR116 cluster bacterium]|nr:MAG: Uncharacterised protein [SAR116 cluster bacterium]